MYVTDPLSIASLCNSSISGKEGHEDEILPPLFDINLNFNFDCNCGVETIGVVLRSPLEVPRMLAAVFVAQSRKTILRIQNFLALNSSLEVTG